MTPVVRLLIMANVAGFALQTLLPQVANLMVFVPRLALSQPWTVVTYMFLHGGLMHLAFNMLALFFFGPRIEERIGGRSFAILFFLSGITGALLSMFFSGSPIIGASGGVFGVMLAFAWYWPEERIFLWGVLPVPARILVIGTTVLALFGGFGGRGDGVAHFAHLGGYAGAFLYLRWLERGRRRFKEMAAGPTPPTVRTPRLTPSVPTAAAPSMVRRVPGWKEIDMSVVHELNRPEVTRIVDKIEAEGVAALTPQEKRFLSSFVVVEDPAPRGR